MKKIFLIGIFAVFLMASVSATPNWDITGTWTWNYYFGGGTYTHTMIIDSMDLTTGIFQGHGYYNVNDAYTWIIVDGVVDGNNIDYTIDYTGLNQDYYVDAIGVISFSTYMSGTATAPGQSGTWDAIGTAKIIRRADITSPVIDEEISGDIDFKAYLISETANEKVSWAVRKGTCAANTNTVLGNVDGFKDIFSWTYNAETFTYDFLASANTCDWEPEEYCFVFNPGGGIRLTRWFKVTNDYCDDDNDGVPNIYDLCPETSSDEPTEELGTNRHIWYEGNYFTTLVPAGRGEFSQVESEFSIADTHGCSCTQILNAIKEATGGDELLGHYKFGCSKSILEAWIANKYYIGPTYIETVEVPANTATPTSSIAVLESGKDYFLKAYGVACAEMNTPDVCTIFFDAEYAQNVRGATKEWKDGVEGYEVYGLDLLDLKVDDNFVDWGGFNEEHTYQIPYAGTGNKLLLHIYDIYYPNNVGSLFVDILEDKWVSLW